MYTLIEHPVGVFGEAVVLSMELNRLRLTAPGFSDVLEFTQAGNEWVNEEGQKIEIVFLQLGTGEAGAVIPSAALTLAAGAVASYTAEG